MKDTFTDLWYGAIVPWETCGVGDKRSVQLCTLRERHRGMLHEELNDAQKETFQKYLDCSEEYLLRMMELAFQDGYCLASRLAAEALIKSGSGV